MPIVFRDALASCSVEFFLEFRFHMYGDEGGKISDIELRIRVVVYICAGTPW
jgi:hypothetical protein